MALVRFLVDYRGVLTGERYYRAGDVIEMGNVTQLVAAGRVELVEETKPAQPAAEPKPKTVRTKRSRRKSNA